MRVALDVLYRSFPHSSSLTDTRTWYTSNLKEHDDDGGGGGGGTEKKKKTNKNRNVIRLGLFGLRKPVPYIT